MRRGTHAVGALALYTGLSLGCFGRGVLGAPSGRVVGDVGPDKTIFMWAFEWWPHALAGGSDPFVSRSVWAPEGIDLSWVTGLPGPSVATYPLTMAAGPVVTYNVLALLAPALAAWTAFLLAQWLTKTYWPSLAAGFLFGFSAYEAAQTQGHLHLTLVFLVPLCALLAGRRLAGELSRRRFVCLLGAALAFQLLISTEVFATTLIVGVLGAVAAVCVLPLDPVLRIGALARESLFALALGCLLTLPYLVHALVLTGPSYAPVRSPFTQSADVLNLAVPTRVTWLRPPGSATVARHFTANPVEAGAYLGLPLLVILVLAGLRRRPLTSVLLLTLVLVSACSLGARVRVGGHALLPGPWSAAAQLPPAQPILPVRFSLFVALLAALLFALWLAEGGRRRWALALVALAATTPNPSRSLWTSDVPRPELFRDGHSDAVLRRGETALVFPFGGAGWSMLWQAEDGFRYRLAGGYLGNRPPQERRWQELLRALISGRRLPAQAAAGLRRYAEAHCVRVVVVAPGTKPALRRLARTLPAVPVHRAGATLYRLRTCRHGPVAARARRT